VFHIRGGRSPEKKKREEKSGVSTYSAERREDEVDRDFKYWKEGDLDAHCHMICGLDTCEPGSEICNRRPE